MIPEGMMVTFEIAVGFAKTETSNDAQFSVTMYSNNGNPVAVIFGDTVLNGDIAESLPDNPENSQVTNTDYAELNTTIMPHAIDLPIIYDPAPSSLPNLGKNNEYVNVDQSFSYFSSSSINGYALQSRTYFAPAYNEFVITTSSYCSNVQNNYTDSDLFLAETCVSKVDVTLVADPLDRTTTNAVQMLGVNDYDYEYMNTGFYQNLSDLFTDITDILGISSALLTRMYNELAGRLDSSFNPDEDTNRVAVELYFGIYNYADFDSSALCIPLVFPVQVASQSNYEGDSVFTITHAIQYRTKLTYLVGGDVSYLYWNSEQVVEKVTVDLG